MKKLALTVACALMSVYTYGQGNIGTISFDTSVGGMVINGDTGLAAATDCSAQLLYATAVDGVYAPLGAAESFFGDTVEAGAGFVIGPILNISGKWAGDQVYVEMQAWRNSDTQRLYVGTSAPLQVTLGGTQHDGSASAFPAALTGLQGFAIPPSIVPEPSTIALGLIGAAALLLRRRQ